MNSSLPQPHHEHPATMLKNLIRNFIALIIILTVAACTKTTQPPTSQPQIIATIFPLADLTQQIVGNTIPVQLILPPGRSPHGYELTPSDRLNLRNAQILIKAGGGVDSWIEKAAHNESESNQLQSLDFLTISSPQATEDDAAHNHDDHAGHAHVGPNPHQWLVPKNAKTFITKLRDTLIIQYPEHATTFTNNTNTLLAALDTLDQEYQTALTPFQNPRIITFHDAFDPLADAYHIKVAASVFTVESQQITPADLSRIENLVTNQGIRALFIEPQFTDTASLQRRLGDQITIRTLDPLGGTSSATSYIKLMRQNLKTLIAGLAENLPDPTANNNPNDG